MSLGSGRGWITPVKGYKVQDGKLVKKPPRMAAGQARNKHQQAARKAKAWQSRSK